MEKIKEDNNSNFYSKVEVSSKLGELKETYDVGDFVYFPPNSRKGEPYIVQILKIEEKSDLSVQLWTKVKCEIQC